MFKKLKQKLKESVEQATSPAPTPTKETPVPEGNLLDLDTTPTPSSSTSPQASSTPHSRGKPNESGNLVDTTDGPSDGFITATSQSLLDTTPQASQSGLARDAQRENELAKLLKAREAEVEKLKIHILQDSQAEEASNSKGTDEKVRRLESLLRRCKDTILAGIEKQTSLTAEKEALKADLARHDAELVALKEAANNTDGRSTETGQETEILRITLREAGEEVERLKAALDSRRRHRDHPSGEVVSYVANGEGRDEPDIRFGHMIQEAPPPYEFLNDDDCSPPPYVPIPGVHPPFVLSNGLSNGLISLNDPLHTAPVGLNEISTLARGHDCQTQPDVQHQQRQTAGEVAGVELNSARNSSGLSSPGVSDRSLGIFSSAQSTPGAVYSNMGTLVGEHQCSGSRELVGNEAASRVKMENNGHVTENSGGAGQGNSSTNECSLQASSNDRVKARADRIATLLKSSSGSNPGNRTSAGAVAENSNSNNSQGTAAALPARSECAYRCETSATPVHSMSNHLSRAQNSEFNSTGPESLGYSEEGSGHRMSGETDTDGGLYDPHNEDTNLLPPHNAM